MKEINASFKVLASEMNLVTSQFAKNDKSVQALTSRKSVLTKEIDAQKDKISTLEKALQNAEQSFGANDKRTQAWAVQLNNAKAELNGMERELSDNNKELDKAEKGMDSAGKETDEFGKSVDKAGDELDETGKDTKEFGKEVDDDSKKTSIFGDVLKATLAAEAIKAGLKMLVDGIKAVGAAVKDYVADSMNMATEASMSQTLLTQVMRNMMDATDDGLRRIIGQVDSLMNLVSAQEKVGVVSKTAQTTALAELASFVGRRESLEDMLPVMNDYIAYQYGANASSEQARNVATSLGKAIDGNIDGLSKQGFKLTQAEKDRMIPGNPWFKTATEMERVEFVTNMVSESMAGVNEALAQTDAGKMAQLSTVMDNTKISVGTMANEFKAAILGQMLPSISSLSDAFLGVIRGEGSVEEMAGAFDDVFAQIIVIIEEFLPKLVEIGGNLITALAMGLSNNMGTIVSGALSLMNQLIKAILDLLPVVLDAGTKLLFGLVDGIIKALPSLVNAAVQIVVALAQGVGDALPTLIPAAVEVVVTIVQSLADSLPLILDAALGLIVGLAEGLLAAIPVLIDALPAIIMAIVDFVIDSIPKIIDAGIKLLTSLVTALPTIITAIVEAIPKIIDNVIAAVIGAIPLIIDAGIKLLVSLIQALPQIITTIVAAIPQIVMGLVNAIVGNIDKIIMAGVQLLVALIQNLPTIIVEVCKAVPQIVTGIVTSIVSFVPKLAECGLNLIKGLWQGISDAGAWLRDKIAGFFGGVVSSIKSFFGIKSPSTLFAGLGVNMVEGLGLGFGEQMNKVGEDMQNAIPREFDTDVKGNFFASGEKVGRRGTVIHQSVSITSPKALSEKEAARTFRNLSRKLALEGV